MTDKPKFDTSGNSLHVEDAWRQYQDELTEHQNESALEAEVKLLNDTSYEDFKMARSVQDRLIVSPDTPLDEMSFQDFKKARAREQETELPAMGKSYSEYKMTHKLPLTRRD